MQKEFLSKQIIYTTGYWFLEGTLFNLAASTRTGFNKDNGCIPAAIMWSLRGY
jgi:hypothetical protein